MESEVALLQQNSLHFPVALRKAEVGSMGTAGDKSPGKAALSPAEEMVVWNPEVEVCLFHTMLGHKAVQVNRHFHMFCNQDKFSQNIEHQVPSMVIWGHLNPVFNMKALHKSEILLFPDPERNFILPDEIIQEVQQGKVIIEEMKDMKEDVGPDRSTRVHKGPQAATRHPNCSQGPPFSPMENKTGYFASFT